jgi:GNAT superfamily N-acetyltransferase
VAILRLINQAGWAYTRTEIERLIRVQPKGMLLLRGSGFRHEVMGCGYASCWGTLGFIGLMLVRSSLRRKGLGRVIMDRALEILRKGGCTTIGLDAVADAVDFYSRMGFRSHWESLRLSVDTRKVTIPFYEGTARRAITTDLPAVYELDRVVSGMDRSLLLDRLSRSEDCSMLVAPGTKDLLAFSVLRRSKGCLRLGPLVAVDGPDGATAARDIIVMAMAESVPRIMTMNVPAYNDRAVEVLESLGMERSPSCIRMYLGDPGPAGAPPGVWALGAAEKG